MGIQFDAAQARQWLADAGYPNGAGLPPITLWCSTGPQALAQRIRQAWIDNLGVTVTLQAVAFGELIPKLDNGEAQVWGPYAYCPDYNDAYCFLDWAVLDSRQWYGGWSNASYDDLLRRSESEHDQIARAALYRQAEEILVETDAVVLPVYYWQTINVAAKPDLYRTYPGYDAPDVATWRRWTQHIFLPAIRKR